MASQTADQSVPLQSIEDVLRAAGLVEGELVHVIGRVVRPREPIAGLPNAIQVRFISSSQPRGGASYVCVPVDICRPADCAEEPIVSVVREDGDG